MNQLLKKTIPYLITLLITTSIFLLALKIKGIYPFGNIDLTNCDGLYQYKPILYNFIQSIKEGTISSYNFLNGLGNPTIFNYLYYLASPLNLIALLANNPDTMNFLVILIKTLLTSCCALFYFKKRTKNNLISTICALSYTFSGWYLAYYFNIMWLDSFAVFPILQYGLEELMENRKYNIYIFSLAYIMLTNFYMAFMVCIYVFIYYMYNIIKKKDKYINKITNFQLIMFSTIICCLLASFSIYATYSSFLKMGIYVNDTSFDLNVITVLGVIKSFFIGTISQNISLYDESIPNIGLSLIFLISILYYFINKKIPLKQKILTLISFIFIIFVFYSKQMNYLINCFHMPIGYSFRYSFIVSFYMLIIFVRNYKTFDSHIDKRVFLINAILLTLLIIEYLNNYMDATQFIYNLAFLASYTIFFIFYSKNKLHKFLFASLISLEIFLSLLMAFSLNTKEIRPYNYETSYSKETRHFKTSTELVNDNLYSGTSTIETFSSMQYNNVISFLESLGCATDSKANIYGCSESEVLSMLFNIENEYTLPKIYSVNNTIFDYLEVPNAVDNLNNFIEKGTGIKDIIVEEKLTSTKENPYLYHVNENRKYIFNFDENLKYLKINNQIYTYSLDSIPEEYKGLNITTKISIITSLALEVKKTDEIEIMYSEDTEDKTLTLYYVDQEKLQEAYNILKNGAIHYTTYSDNEIEGEIDVDEDKVILTTIPYDTSWEVTIDNEIVKPTSLNRTLLAIECPPGHHTIKLKYKSDFKVASTISIITLIGLIANSIYQRKKNNKKILN